MVNILSVIGLIFKSTNKILKIQIIGTSIFFMISPL